MKNIARYSLSFLLVFLPLSAWLASVTGTIGIVFARDVALLAVAATCFTQISSLRQHHTVLLVAIASYCAVVILSGLNGDASLSQYARGVRHALWPFVLLLISIALSRSNKITLDELKVPFFVGLFLAVAGAAIEIISPSLLRVSLSSNDFVGRLSDVHLADNIVRVQSFFAGPNALGLYLAISAFVLLALGSGKFKLPAFALVVLVLLLSFSRSSVLGMLLATAVGIALITGRDRKALISVVLVIITGVILLLSINSGELVRSESDSTRLAQYERVWNEREEIGFFGRGAGASGPASQNRLDEGANRFTENSYLDHYEQFGVLGFLFYLLIWLEVIKGLLRLGSPSSKYIFLSVLALCTAGLFINHYTGQAAIWVLMIFTGVVLGANNKEHAHSS